jgi:tRNA pseudouridine55 synthase
MAGVDKQELTKSPASVNGIVVIDKPAGMTSHDVVSVARKLFRTKRVGHTGTLDPDATGVLVLCLGNATRIAEYLSAARKHYVADVVFGIETDTQDASGQVLAERDASHLTEDEVRRVLTAFRGAIQQVPPMVSALHHEGQRLYDLARQGIVVERAARAVQIDELELTAWTPGSHPTARLEITCSTGTYIRSLAADIGAAIGVGGMMQTLCRTWVGERDGETLAAERPFTLDAAHTLDELRERAQSGTLAEVVLPLTAALSSWPQIRLDAEQTTHTRHGRALLLADISDAQRVNWNEAAALTDEQTLVALLDTGADVIAVAYVRDGQLQPHKVFAS